MTFHKKALIYIGLAFVPLLAFSAPKERGPSDSISDCMVISVPGAYTLSGNLPGSSGYLSDGSCLVIEASPVSIDLQGHSIIGLGSGYGITDNGVPYQNTRISNGNVSGFITGISLAASSRSAVENIHVTDNMQDGIVLGGSSKMFQNVASGNTRGLVIQCPGNALGNSAWGNSEYDLYKIDPNLCLLTEGLNSLGTSGNNCATCEAVGLTECSGDCIDLLNDRYNCGSCGSACAAGYICANGNCSLSCPSGLVEVAGTCVDPLSDEDYCGATPSNSGTSCASGQLCTFGACAVSCPSGQDDCYGLCSSLDTDEENCGFCGNACGTGEYCASGLCQAFGG